MSSRSHARRRGSRRPAALGDRAARTGAWAGALGGVESLEPRLALAVTVVNPLPDITALAVATSQTIPLAGRFDDTAVTGTVVRFTTNAATPNDRFYVELFDQAGQARTRTTPQTVANFLAYADEGRFANTIIHRSVGNFVVQGGGFTAPTAPYGEVGGAPTVIAKKPAVVNEPGNTNIRGTIAMAKVGGDPNSATNQWFINLADNSSDPANLDTQNGGFTAFGRVLGNGMTAVDAMAAVPTYNAAAYYGQYGSAVYPSGENGAFNEIPLRAIPNPIPNPLVVQPAQFVTMPAVSRVGELVHTVTSSKPGLVAATIGDGVLRLDYAAGQTGTAVITVRAASVLDPTDFKEDQFTVVRQPPLANGMIGRAGNELWISRKTAAGSSTTLLATLPSATVTATLTGDFNADGRTDAAVRNGSGQWQVVLTPASGTAIPQVWSTWPVSIDWTNFVAGDFNGDGRFDIAARNPSNGNWRIGVSTGSGFTDAAYWNWPANVAWSEVMTGDFSGDGRTDILGRDPVTGQWRLSRFNGASYVSSTVATWSNAITWTNVVSGDFNGDGRTDFAGRNPVSGNWRLALSTGVGFSDLYQWNWSPAVAWINVMAGDFDGDGRTDIAGRDALTGGWRVSRISGTTAVSSHFGTWGASIPYDFFMVGDFNGDGRADISARNRNTGTWRVGLGSATAFTDTAYWNWTTLKTWSWAAAVRT